MDWLSPLSNPSLDALAAEIALSLAPEPEREREREEVEEEWMATNHGGQT